MFERFSRQVLFAVGEHSRFLAYDGKFSKVELLGNSPLNVGAFIVEHDADALLAVGGSRSLVSAIARFEAGAWTVLGRAELPGQVNGFQSIVRSDQGLFVGGGGFACERPAPILRWDDAQATWVDETPAQSRYNCWRLAAVEQGTVAVVGAEALLRRDATGLWQPVETPAKCVADLWGGPKGELVLVGDTGAVHHFDGSSWRKHAIFPQAQGAFIDGVAADDLFLAGQTKSLIYCAHFDGERWHDIFTDLAFAHRLILGLVATGPGEALAFGSNGLCLRLSAEGKVTRVPTKTKAALSCAYRL